MLGIRHWGKIAFLGLAIRVALIMLLSQYESIYNQDLALTDIDYKVYSDAALYDSPYERHTYRYSPLLAYLMAFNYSHHEVIGKIILALFDVFAIGLVYYVNSRNENEIIGTNYGMLSAKIYAFNPLFIYLTVRGSCESITLCLLYAFWSLYWGGKADGHKSILEMRAKRVDQHQPSVQKRWASYAIFGLLVHFRIYPILFVPFILAHQYHLSHTNKVSALIKGFFEISLVAGGVFLGLGLLFYSWYGRQFVEETYLYHWGRLDNRHSFSAFFY